MKLSKHIHNSSLKIHLRVHSEWSPFHMQVLKEIPCMRKSNINIKKMLHSNNRYQLICCLFTLWKTYIFSSFNIYLLFWYISVCTSMSIHVLYGCRDLGKSDEWIIFPGHGATGAWLYVLCKSSKHLKPWTISSVNELCFIILSSVSAYFMAWWLTMPSWEIPRSQSFGIL